MQFAQLHNRSWKLILQFGRVDFVVSAKAGLRAGEIAHLTWAMITDPTGAIGTVLELPDRAAKKGSGRVIPLHEDLQTALAGWRAVIHSDCPVIVSERGGRMGGMCDYLRALE